MRRAPTSEEEDHVVDINGRCEEDGDGERGGDLPGGGSLSEDLYRGEGGLETLRTVCVCLWSSPGHQQNPLSSLLVGGAGGGHSRLVGVWEELYEPLQIISDH